MNEMKRKQTSDIDTMSSDDKLGDYLVAAENRYDRLLKYAIDTLERLKSADEELLMIEKRKSINEKKRVTSLEGHERRRMNKKRILPTLVKRKSQEEVR